MTLILVLFAVAIGGPAFAIGLLLGRWEARQGADRRPAPHQALALVCEPVGCDGGDWP